MHPIATLFRSILGGLQVVIANLAVRQPARAEILVRISHHLGRTIQRLEKLVTRWRNNTLPKPRQRGPRPTRALTTPRLPRGKSWLIRNVDHYNARGHALQLQHFLATPECIAFLAEVPRAGKILRPLARSLGIQMPGDPPPPLPKPARPPKPAKSPFLPLPQAGSNCEAGRGWGDAAREAHNIPLTLCHPIFSKAR